MRVITETEVMKVIDDPAEEMPLDKNRVNLWEKPAKTGLKITICRENDIITVVTAIRKD